MAARSRRTRFAASFVAVIASGSACSHDAQPTGAGTGTASGTAEPVHPNPPPVDPGTAPPQDPPDAAPRAITSAWNISKKPDGTCEGFDDQCTVMGSHMKPGDPIPPC